MRRMTTHDRFGLGWREALAGGLLARLDRIDVLEVVAEEWLARPRREWSALARLARELPLHVHGVSLGAASTVPVAQERLDRVAAFVGALEPEAWSEHLAFVRGGGREIGHLMAPPRHASTLEGLAENVRRATATVGAAPLLENVATLIDPPCSTMDELTWTRAVLGATPAPLLLDLHNLYANALNFGFDAFAFLEALPSARIGAVHIAGGHRAAGSSAAGSSAAGCTAGRWVDDHLHAVPDPVFDLLEALAARAAGPLTVILERDGAFEGVAPLVAELDRARTAVSRGRRRLAHAPA
jgi:uncharacterized protein (UPF0276 family)